MRNSLPTTNTGVALLPTPSYIPGVVPVWAGPLPRLPVYLVEELGHVVPVHPRLLGLRLLLLLLLLHGWAEGELCQVL